MLNCPEYNNISGYLKNKKNQPMADDHERTRTVIDLYEVNTFFNIWYICDS